MDELNKTFTLYGNPEVFLNNNSYMFNKYGFIATPQGLFISHGIQGNYLFSEKINKSSPEYGKLLNFLKYKEGKIIKYDDIEAHLQILYHMQNNSNYHYSKYYFPENMVIDNSKYPFSLIYNDNNTPDQPKLITQDSKNYKHKDIFVIENKLIHKNLKKINNPKTKQIFLKQWSQMTKDHYEYNKNLSYGLQGELELIIENNLGDYTNKSINRYLEKNKNISFETFIKRHETGTILYENKQYVPILLHPSLNMSGLKDYLDNRRDEYIKYLNETSYENFIKDSNERISKTLLDNSSVLLKPFTGPLYTINGENQKPFTCINQLLTRQHFADNNLSIPVYSKNTTIHKKFHPSITKGELGIILSTYNKKKKSNQEHVYFSHSQLQNNLNKSVSVSSYLNNPVPTAIDNSKPPECKEIKNDPVKNFEENDIKNFIFHSFHNTTYEPSKTLKNYKTLIATEIKKGNIDLTHLINKNIKDIYKNKEYKGHIQKDINRDKENQL